MFAPGYTHLLDTVTYEIQKDDVVVGWGKYYGPMVENGTVKMQGTTHLRPTFERNKEKYYKDMQKHYSDKEEIMGITSKNRPEKKRSVLSISVLI